MAIYLVYAWALRDPATTWSWEGQQTQAACAIRRVVKSADWCCVAVVGSEVASVLEATRDSATADDDVEVELAQAHRAVVAYDYAGLTWVVLMTMSAKY